MWIRFLDRIWKGCRLLISFRRELAPSCLAGCDLTTFARYIVFIYGVVHIQFPETYNNRRSILSNMKLGMLFNVIMEG